MNDFATGRASTRHHDVDKVTARGDHQADFIAKVKRVVIASIVRHNDLAPLGTILQHADQRVVEF